MSAVGLGCMGLTTEYSQPGRSGWGVSEEEGVELLVAAHAAGCTFWDTAQLCARPLAAARAVG